MFLEDLDVVGRMFLDFGIMSMLLVAAHLLRSRIALLQNFFVPTAIIAGFLGLAGGPEGLDILPFADVPATTISSDDVDSATPSSDLETAVASDAEPPQTSSEEAAAPKNPTPAMAEYPFYLVVLLFGTLLMGHTKKGTMSPRAVMRSVGDTLSYNLASEVGMFGLALLFGAIALVWMFPGLDSSTSSVGGFALLLPAGFVGGHGTANVVGTVLEESGGYEDALTIGYTFATVGLLAGIFGGMILVNIATRKGWTRLVQSAGELPQSVRRGFLEEEERTSLGNQTVSPIALDPFTWHIALALVAFGSAFLLDAAFRWGFPDSKFTLPLFALSMLAGALVQKTLDKVGIGEFVDKSAMSRIGSATSDYLIAFGVASIKLTVVLQYWQPLLVMSIFGVAYSMVLLFLIGQSIFRNFWFERSVFVYGWNTGVVAIGITLLRVVDPRLKSQTLEQFGLAYVFISFVEIGMLITLPALVANGYVVAPGLVLTALFVSLILISRYMIGWFRKAPDELREGEQQAIDQIASTSR